MQIAKVMKGRQREELLRTLRVRFEKHMNRHEGLEWARVHARLEANPDKLWALNEMERTGGEPDVVGHDKKTGEYGSWLPMTGRGADRQDEGGSGSKVVATSGGGIPTPVFSGTSQNQPPKSFVDSEDNQDDPIEPNPLLD
jgi:hypothetical protein